MADETKVWLPEPDEDGAYTYPDGSRIKRDRSGLWQGWWANGIPMRGARDELKLYVTAEKVAGWLAEANEGPAASTAKLQTAYATVRFEIETEVDLSEEELRSFQIDFDSKALRLMNASVPGRGCVGRVVGYTNLGHTGEPGKQESAPTDA